MFSWLEPPNLDEEERSRRAALVRGLITIMMAMAVIGMVPALLEPKNSLLVTLGFYGAVLGWLVVVRVILNKGNVVLAAWILSMFFWVLVAFVTLFFGGMQGQNASTFAVTILLIGGVVSGRAALLLAIISSAWCAFVVWLELRGALPGTFGPYSPLNAWGAVTITLVLTSVLLKNSTESLQRMMARAQSSSEERDRALRRSIQGQKMELVGNLTSGIAHDFNNLLTVIGSASFLIRKETAKMDPESSAWLDDLDGATSRATLLTRQLLSFGRAPIAELAVVDLAAVVRDLERMLPRLLGSTIRIRVSTEVGAHVLASRAGLEQILLNLAVNARDAMPEGGEFDIGLRCTEDEVILSTSDTGIGMDAATQERIFEPFFTTKVMGTGLGLATVRQLVSSFQGSIELESAPDRGTTFRVRFARSDEVPAVEARSRSERPPVSASLRRRILLVEDDPLVRRGLTRSLEHQGYEVIPTLDGAEALGLLSSGAHIDVVVSDIAMPRVDGDQLAEALAERHPRLPVVLLSGNRSPRVDPAPLGRVFLEKPVDARVLVKTIEDLIAAQR